MELERSAAIEGGVSAALDAARQYFLHNRYEIYTESESGFQVERERICCKSGIKRARAQIAGGRLTVTAEIRDDVHWARAACAYGLAGAALGSAIIALLFGYPMRGELIEEPWFSWLPWPRLLAIVFAFLLLAAYGASAAFARRRAAVETFDLLVANLRGVASPEQARQHAAPEVPQRWHFERFLRVGGNARDVVSAAQVSLIARGFKILRAADGELDAGPGVCNAPLLAYPRVHVRFQDGHLALTARRPGISRYYAVLGPQMFALGAGIGAWAYLFYYVMINVDVFLVHLLGCPLIAALGCPLPRWHSERIRIRNELADVWGEIRDSALRSDEEAA